jgi:hypothetical protein
LPATPEEAKRLAEVIGVITELAHQKKTNSSFQHCGGKSIKKTLIPNHLSFYDYQCNVCFCNREIQEYRIYLDRICTRI